jgi:hypothetical protein
MESKREQARRKSREQGRIEEDRERAKAVHDIPGYNGTEGQLADEVMVMALMDAPGYYQRG